MGGAMKQGFNFDKQWSDRFIGDIKPILGMHLIGEASFDEDAKRNTDLIVLKMDAVRIGCRLRREKYLNRYGDEFTIRCDRPNGAKTELAKIIEGWGDYFFYGFASDQDGLVRWTLADMKRFRLWFNQRLMVDKKVPGFRGKNPDGSSEFIAFRWRDLPDDFIVARNWKESA